MTKENSLPQVFTYDHWDACSGIIKLPVATGPQRRQTPRSYGGKKTSRISGLRVTVVDTLQPHSPPRIRYQ